VYIPDDRLARVNPPIPSTRDPAAASGEAAAAGGAFLDQKSENRESWEKKNAPEEGEIRLLPVRSGGGYDRLGPRAVDLKTANDIVAIATHMGGDHAFITLTQDRRLYLGPAFAYCVCSEVIREVLQPVARDGVFFTTLEWQGKTGEGWAHWHVLLPIKDGMSIEEVTRQVVQRWSMREECGVNVETGEVKFARVALGRVDVRPVTSLIGASKYIAKYVVKDDPAGPPPWLLQSRRQLRKYRKSGGWLKLSAQLGLHKPKFGSRRPPVSYRRPARTLLERIAMSGMSSRVVRWRDGRWSTVGFLPMPTLLVPKGGVQRMSRSRGEFSEVYRLPPGSWDLLLAAVARQRERICATVELLKQDRRLRTGDRWRRVQEDRMWESAVDAVKHPHAE